MYFEQFYLGCLSHASYMLASEDVAAVVDPQRDVGIYIDEARKQGFLIKYVIETHLHADFVSGHRELAALTGAQIYVGARAGAKFQHIPVHDGDTLTFGKCLLMFLETPGHTLESISVVVHDLDKGSEPSAVLTGDTLFIGDVGRPDLSENLTPQQLAGMLYDSLHDKLLKLPDSVVIYPAHGAGSLCGRHMSNERSSTLGKERIGNYALRPKTREEFVLLLTAELPERPGYFALDVEINRAGAGPLQELPEIPAIQPRDVLAAQQRGGTILDTRPATEFCAAHIRGSMHIGLSGQYASWAGVLLGLDQDIILIAEDDERIEESRLRLARVGIERVTGYLAGGLPAWIGDGLPVRQTSQISVEQLAEDPAALQIVDVRRLAEWDAGHVAEAHLKPLNRLTSMLTDLDAARPTAVYCKGGYRSAIACSLLERAGFENVINVIGGFDAWLACNLPAAAVASQAT